MTQQMRRGTVAEQLIGVLRQAGVGRMIDVARANLRNIPRP